MSSNFIERPRKNEKDEAIEYVKTLLERAREDSCREDISKLEDIINLLQTIGILMKGDYIKKIT